MADLVSTIIQSFSPDVIGKLSSLLGLQHTAVRNGLAAAVPGLLSQLASTASHYDSVQKLSRAVSQVESLARHKSDIVKAVSEPSQSVIGSGWNIASTLLGNDALETISFATAKTAGLDIGAARKLLGFAAPVVLASLKREQARANLNNFGLVRLIGSQKGNFERASPPGFGQAIADSFSRPSPSPTAPSTPAYKTASSNFEWSRWAVSGLVAAALSFLIISQVQKRTTLPLVQQDATVTTQTAPAQTAPAQTTEALKASVPDATSPTTEAVDQRLRATVGTLENEASASLDRLLAVLPKLNDSASAQAAVTEIREISSHLAQVHSDSLKLSADAGKTVSDAFSAKLGKINADLEQILRQFSFMNEEEKTTFYKLKADLDALFKS